MRLALPSWLRHYRRQQLGGDLSAGVIVTLMLVPQSLAYALLAGLPPQAGLYASILPIIAYAVLGSSMTLAVGPVAVISLMTASALQPLAAAGSAQYAALAMQLALLSGAMLLAFGMLRLGFLAHLLSHPVVSGFTSGSAILIIVGQLRHLLGVSAPGTTVPQQLLALAKAMPETKPVTLVFGLGSLLLLWLARRSLASGLQRFGVSESVASTAARLAPMLVILASIALVASLGLDVRYGVSVVGAVPGGMPTLAMPWPEVASLSALWLPALLISLVGFVESVSVAQSLALRRGQRITPNKELLGLGAANIASAVSGGYPVTGGFARSVVNFAAGAQTPLAGVVSALLMVLVVGTLTGSLAPLPHAALAATIIIAVSSLIDTETLRHTWRHDRADALALIATAGGVILVGVEAGIIAGVVLSLAVLVWRGSRPHIAVIGRVPGTEHFRNIERHPVQTLPGLLAVRIDESLGFTNAAMIEDWLVRRLSAEADIRTVLLVCSAINRIDSTGLEMLTRLESDLRARGLRLMLAEVKGPVMDPLADTDFGRRMHDRIFLSTHQAFLAASGDTAAPCPPSASGPVC